MTPRRNGHWLPPSSSRRLDAARASVRRSPNSSPHLLPDTGGLPGPFPELEFMERRRVVTGFRGHAAIEWRRRGMISFDRAVMRSLRVGRAFREHSRLRQQSRASLVARNGSKHSTLVLLAEPLEVADETNEGT